MVNAVNGPNGYYAYGPAPTSAPVTPANYSPATAGTYQSDAYNGGMYSSPVSMAASGSISAIVSDPRAASRFGLFMINTPERLLKVGGGMGSFGRGFLNLLAGSVPLFTASNERAQIANNVRVWMSSADLMRTGASPRQAQLLQDIGIWRSQEIAIYGNPADQAVLAGRLAGAAAARGWMADSPNAAMVGTWVQNAQRVTHYNY